MNSFEYHGAGSGELKLSTISTHQLKDKLNRLYASVRSRQAKLSSGLFEYMWDLKELAILEGRQSVSVPSTWLRELDDACEQVFKSAHESHVLADPVVS